MSSETKPTRVTVVMGVHQRGLDELAANTCVLSLDREDVHSLLEIIEDRLRRCHGLDGLDEIVADDHRASYLYYDNSPTQSRQGPEIQDPLLNGALKDFMYNRDSRPRLVQDGALDEYVGNCGIDVESEEMRVSPWGVYFCAYGRKTGDRLESAAIGEADLWAMLIWMGAEKERAWAFEQLAHGNPKRASDFLDPEHRLLEGGPPPPPLRPSAEAITKILQVNDDRARQVAVAYLERWDPAVAENIGGPSLNGHRPAGSQTA